ncbi:MAG: hypothetical protein Q8908_03830 [Bacteroidota bacterium]|nr:hypothetical protein [Bacteroidota bacterium]
MKRKYKFQKPDGIYFVTFITVNRIDFITRPACKDIPVESFHYCIQPKICLYKKGGNFTTVEFTSLRKNEKVAHPKESDPNKHLGSSITIKVNPGGKISIEKLKRIRLN